jgi:hypothetical protein
VELQEEKTSKYCGWIERMPYGKDGDETKSSV